MFNFTTQTVFNEIVEGKNLFKGDGKKPEIRIGNTRFNKSLIENVYIQRPTSASLTSVTFDMSAIEFEDNEKEALARVILYIGLSMSSQDSVYANPFVYKGKPLYVEFKAFKDNAAKTAKEFEKVVKKFELFETDEKLLNVTVSGTTVTIEGVNGYQLIKKAVLLKFNPNAITVDCCTTLGDFETIITGVPVVYKLSNTTANGSFIGKAEAVKNEDTDKELKYVSPTEKEDLGDDEVAILPGIEAFGDYDWIIHNLRLPTYENMNYWTANKLEMPVVGLKYTQFTIVMKDTRDRVAGESVGMRTTSVTTHVLYVAGDYLNSGDSAAKKVYTELTGLNLGAKVQQLWGSASNMEVVNSTEKPFGGK